MDQLRALVTASAEENANGETDETETPAVSEKKTKTEPPTEAAPQEKERNPDGTFVKAKADDEAVPAGVQKRIDKAVKAQRDAERELATERAKNTQVQPPAKETVPPAAPKQEDFTTYDEYSRAISRFEARQEIDKEVAKQVEAAAKTQREAQQAKRAKAFGDAEIEARKTRDDYDEVTAGIVWPKAPGSAAMADYILETNGAALYYALGEQPAEIERIAAMPPLLAIAAIAKFEAKLEAPAVTETPVKTALPKPPKNVGGGGSPAAVDLDKASMPVFKREMAKLLKKSD